MASEANGQHDPTATPKPEINGEQCLLDAHALGDGGVLFAKNKRADANMVVKMLGCGVGAPVELRIL